MGITEGRDGVEPLLVRAIPQNVGTIFTHIEGQSLSVSRFRQTNNRRDGGIEDAKLTVASLIGPVATVGAPNVRISRRRVTGQALRRLVVILDATRLVTHQTTHRSGIAADNGVFTSILRSLPGARSY